MAEVTPTVTALQPASRRSGRSVELLRLDNRLPARSVQREEVARTVRRVVLLHAPTVRIAARQCAGRQLRRRWARTLRSFDFQTGRSTPSPLQVNYRR